MTAIGAKGAFADLSKSAKCFQRTWQLNSMQPITTGPLGEERVRRAGRPSLLHMNDSRPQFKFGKAEAELVR